MTEIRKFACWDGPEEAPLVRKWVPLDDYNQLRGTLSLAEEGLANYAQEVKTLQNERDEMDEQIQNLQCALDFWLPCVPEVCKDEKIIDRIFHDGYLLAGYEGPVVESAEDLKWITITAEPQGAGK